jgi:FtsZ-interacting cell division protein ZipA
MNSQVWTAIGAIMIIALIVVGAWFCYKQYRSRRLKARFGSEYDHAVRNLHDRDLAEAELKSREQRVERFHIVPLSAADSSVYEERWIAVQGHFVDDPKAAVQEAHQLIFEVMKKRGYPISDFEQAAADLSVQYPDLVSDYRAASRIAENNRRGAAETEELRQALVYYRALFKELLQSRNAAAGTRDMRPQKTTSSERSQPAHGGGLLP